MKYIFSLGNLVFFFFLLANVRAEETPVLKRQLLTLKEEMVQGDKKLSLIIHYRENQRYLAKRTLEIARTYFPKIHAYFNYMPQTQVHFVYEEASLESNGSAQVFPYNIIRLQDYPPTGDSSLIASHDWLKTLIVHEYIHIVTLEMTNGWIDSLRSVFGSTMKFAALNPRWFLEGIATWGESYFTQEGRLYHPSIINVVAQLLKDPDFCQDLSCWDTPKQYPHGSAAYWVGAHFLNFVETNKKNTLSCWADGNSRSFPFFVNKRFTQCYGKDIYTAYNEFQNYFLKQYDHFQCPFKNVNACKALEKFKSNHNDFKGVLENENYAATIINIGKKGSASALRAEQLFLFDIKQNKPSRIILPQRVEQLYHPKSNSFLISFLYSSFVPGTRLFAEYDLVNKKVDFFSEKMCNDKNDKNFNVVAYVFPQDANNAICIRYKLQRWEVGLVKDEVWNLLYQFNLGEQMYHPSIGSINNQLSLTYFDRPVLPNKVSESMGAFSNPKLLVKKLPDVSSLSPAPEMEQKLEGEKDYHPFSYFYPNYLLLEYLSSGEVDSYGVSTSFSDPRNRHKLDALLLYNDGLNDGHAPFSGIASYSYLPSYLPDLNLLNQIFYSKLRFQFPQDRTNRQRVQEESGFLLKYDWSKTLWQFSLGTKGSRVDEADPYASRKIQKLALTSSVGYLNNAASTKLKALSNNIEAGYADNKLGDSYPYAIFLHKQIWQWNEDWRSIFSYQYGKMFTKDNSNLVNGAFYGGGAPSVFSINYPFPSYLLGYGALLGDEMMTGQLRQDWTFSYPFSGNGLFPFYLKSMGAIAGVEYLQADKMYYDLITENDPKLWVGFLGAKFGSQILFLLPVDIEIVYAKSLDDKRTRSNLSIMLQSNITF